MTFWSVFTSGVCVWGLLFGLTCVFLFIDLPEANSSFPDCVWRTGISSPDLRQSYRVHPVYEAKKPHTPAGHRRPEAAKRPAGAARYFRSARTPFEMFSTLFSIGQLVYFSKSSVSPGFQCAPWRRWRAPRSSRPATSPPTADSTPTPKAPPCPRSTGAPTPAPSRKRTSLPTGRSCAWSPARGAEKIKFKKKKTPRPRFWAAGQQRARWNTAGLDCLLPLSLRQPPSSSSRSPAGKSAARPPPRAAMTVGTQRKSAGWRPLLQSSERASVFVPRLPPSFLSPSVLRHRHLPARINNSNPRNGQLSNFRTLWFVVPSVKPLPLPQVFFFSLGEEVEHVKRTPPSTAIHIYIYIYMCIFFFLLLFLIQTQSHTQT